MSTSKPRPAPIPTQTMRVEIAPKTWIAAALVIAAVWIVLKVAVVVLVLIGALMIVGSLNPVVSWLEQRKCRRSVAIVVVFGIASALAAVGLSLTVPPLLEQARNVIEREPQIREQVVSYLSASPVTHAMGEWVRDMQYPDLLKEARSTLLDVSLRAIEIAAYLSAAVFLALYMMIDRDRLRGGLYALVPRRHHVRTSRVLLNLETIVGGYIRGQVITCVMIGVFIYIMLTALNVPNALALAVLGGAMDVLPYIGALITIIPIAIAAYSVGPGTALVVLALMFVYEEFESRVLVPVVYGRALRLPSSMVLFSLLVGGVLGGVVGAFLALPIASAILMLHDELRVELPGETEQPKDVQLRQKDEREEREYEVRTQDAPAVEASAVAVELARERKAEEEHEAADAAK